MSAIDDYVIRNGKWVSGAKTDTIPGEVCISESDGYGFYAYKISYIPESETFTVMYDKDDNHKKCEDFDYMLTTRGLPKFFGEEEE